jgi:methylenetetrahydrofolate reductase (NADPH)
MNSLKQDDQLVKEYGINLAVNMIKKITQSGEVTGVHFCTLNLERSVHRVLETLQWTVSSPKAQNKLIAVL